MVTVAVAGASTGLGSIIIREILATKKHNVIALSRNENATLAGLGATVRQVDYTSHASLVEALSGVHTVISMLNSLDQSSVLDAQLALLEAAREAGAKRFAPSEYALSTNAVADLFAAKDVVWKACKESGLECTRFTCGLFTNVAGTGTPKGEEEALGGLRPWTYMIDIVAGTVDLVGKGQTKISFTETRDIGKFVAASLELDEWKDEMGMEGDRKTWEEVVEAAERITKRKFLRKYTPTEKVEEEIKANPATKFYNQTRLAMEQGEGVVEPYLNKACPLVRPITMDEYLHKWWDGVELPEPAWREANIIA